MPAANAGQHFANFRFGNLATGALGAIELNAS